MGIKVAREHRPSYPFDRLVEVHPHVVRLPPAPPSRPPIEAYSLQAEPADHFINWQQDAFGNFLARHLRPVDEGEEGSGPGNLPQAWVTNFSVAPPTRTITFPRNTTRIPSGFPRTPHTLQ